MGDFSDFNLDPGITIKSEPMNHDTNNIMITSASVPIPLRRDPPEYIYDDNSQSPLYGTIGLTSDQILSPPNTYEPIASFWGTRMLNNDEALKSEALIHMDEDDIFQVDKADLIQDPTLAELNANDENLLGDFNFDDLLLPNEISFTNLDRNGGFFINNHFGNNNQLIGAASSAPQATMLYRDLDPFSNLNTPPSNHDYSSRTPVSALSPRSPASSTSSAVTSQTSPLHNHCVPPNKHTTLHDLLMKRDKYISPERSMLGQSVPGRETTVISPTVMKYRNHASRLSSSAPTHLGLDQIWQRREPRKHLLSTSSLAEAGSTSSLSTGGVLSPDPPDFSDVEGTDEDSDGHYEDYSSGNDTDNDDETPNKHTNNKREKYFWQYNIQAKGPKGQRLVMKCKMEDPHVLQEVTDPVFSPDCSVRGIKHSGKARKGDGNDLTPNPRKLHAIGRELDKLGRIINDMTPVSELPFNVRPTSRKEKNKLASRACRLKKKAQHEANKIKLSGLEMEHKRYINAIAQLKQIITGKLTDPNMKHSEEVNRHIEKMVKHCTKIKIAGHTTDYVNKILDKIKTGGQPLSASFTEDL